METVADPENERGKFWISGLLRLFLVQFWGKIAGVDPPPLAQRCMQGYCRTQVSYNYSDSMIHSAESAPKLGARLGA